MHESECVKFTKHSFVIVFFINSQTLIVRGNDIIDASYPLTSTKEGVAVQDEK